MSIHILTTDSTITQQLKQLLAGGQQTFRFHEDLEELINLLPKLKKTDKVFYDLGLESSLMAFDALRFGCAKTNLVAFEKLVDGAESVSEECLKNAKHYFVVSSDERKSSVRLKQVLHKIDESAVKRKRALKKARAAKSAVKTTRANKGKATPVTLARYLTAKSSAMQDILARIAEIAKEPRFIFIEGEDGADFELAAREINFRTNGDQSPLHIADPMRVEIDQIKKTICDQDKVAYCYLGLSYELGAMTIERLYNFIESLPKESSAAPSPCFILGHVLDSESYLEADVIKLIKSFKQRSEHLELPAMSDRKEDICMIAQSIFTTLRTAHPFLMTRTLSKDAIEYLEANCANLNYSAVIRVIRNAMALTERDTLSAEEIRSFGDDSPTSQHLIESLADEKYFKQESGVA